MQKTVSIALTNSLRLAIIKYLKLNYCYLTASYNHVVYEEVRCGLRSLKRGYDF